MHTYEFELVEGRYHTMDKFKPGDFVTFLMEEQCERFRYKDGTSDSLEPDANIPMLVISKVEDFSPSHWAKWRVIYCGNVWMAYEDQLTKMEAATH